MFIQNTPKPRFYIGVDTHKFIHTICVINADTDNLLTFTFENEPRHYTEALSKILKVTRSKEIIFGLEDTQSFGFLFSHFLTTNKFEVKQVNPAMAEGYRSTLSNYHKSDEFDAFCVAKVLRDNYKMLPSFQYELTYTNIKLLVGIREQVKKQQSANYTTLHLQLAKMYPGYSKFFCNIQQRGALAFFKQFPTPKRLKGYTVESLSEEMREVTKEFPISRSEKILTIVRMNPIPFNNEIVAGIIVEIIEDIYVKEKRLKKLEEQLAALIEETGYRLQTIPGISVVTEAKIISEIGDIHRFKNNNSLATFAGIAPISVGSSGKNKHYTSKGGNRTLRATIYFLAVGMIRKDGKGIASRPMFRAYYDRKVSEGKTKSQALVSVMRQLIRILYSMMKNKSEWIEPKEKEVPTIDS